jgi:SAM-dependent methyltransferase
MIAQRTSSSPVVCAAAEALPFDDIEFDAAMAILSVHHWEAPHQGLAEMKRISRRQIVFTFDPELQDSLWLVRDYLPQIAELEGKRALPIEDITERLGSTSVIPVAIPHDCTDGFQAAYWRRPEMYLRDDVQATISTLAQLPKEIVSNGMERLRSDLDSGVWRDRYGDLMAQDSHDFGYRIVVAD